MIRLFVYTEEFDKLWKLTGLSDMELRDLENALMANPAKGGVIKGTYGLRKLRWKIAGKGKRGGIRILYVDFPKRAKLFLISLIRKNERDNISEADKKAINVLIKELEK